MIATIAHTARRIFCLEGAVVLFFAMLAIPAVALGTMAAVTTAMVLIPAASAVALWRAVRSVGQSSVIVMPASFSASAVRPFSA